jgi:hypothetical protein
MDSGAQEDREAVSQADDIPARGRLRYPGFELAPVGGDDFIGRDYLDVIKPTDEQHHNRDNGHPDKGGARFYFSVGVH